MYDKMLPMNINLSHLHPCIEYSDIYTKVCSPLQKLGVVFFGYTAVDVQGQAYCLGSRGDYAEQYLLKEHVNKDVHFLPMNDSNKMDYYFWDYAQLDEDESEVYQLARDHNQSHTLTITKRTELMTHCYHFSGQVYDDAINQRYLNEMDLLHSFMDYFDDCLTNIPEIRSIYNHPTNLVGKSHQSDIVIVGDDPRELELDKATSFIRFKNFASYYLTANERECLYWLHRGKSAPLIAQIMQVSNKTVERHVAAIKRKYDCYTLFQLGQKISSKGLTQLLELCG